ncbi:unnamed protein product [Echinostoma caproni]|uniref:Uncharacterized protein n=1 Tax=Echinostoma caproni TaxID=27848 RepID=A0A183BCM4_9TREM|nr:unnamed protein product [Echinostoma caproni]
MAAEFKESRRSDFDRAPKSTVVLIGIWIVSLLAERSRTRRKQRIDMVLKAAALAGDNLDWDNVPGVWIPKNKQERAESPFPCPQSPSDRTFSEKAASTVSEDMDSELMDNENVTQSQFENLQVCDIFSSKKDFVDDLLEKPNYKSWPRIHVCYVMNLVVNRANKA